MLLTDKQQIQQRVEECFAIANAYFDKQFELPSVHFNQRGKIAGCARLQKNEIRFNPTLAQDNLQTFLDEVVPHEVSHILTFSLYGRVRPHGKEWQAMMIDLFKLFPSTYHQMDVTKVRGKHFTYQCQCGPLELSVRRHNKVVRGQQQYICKKCKTTLKEVNFNSKL